MPTDQGVSHKPPDRGRRLADTAPIRKTPFSAALKRCLDLAFSLIALAGVLPLLLLACLAIKLDSPGSVLYRQWRSGRDGKPFQILKLRSMVDSADRLGPRLTQSVDPRVTRIGSVLRRWSIDELPQLLNVLAGQMSIVGPRPEVVTIVARYTPRQRGVLRALPGITGWSQVNGRDDLSIAEKLELDLDYAMHRTTLWDLIILARTIRVVLNGRGVKR
jgi:lipopolysaccharide/colanic/teichoic acid biosynthesis glycosyltransferase